MINLFHLIFSKKTPLAIMLILLCSCAENDDDERYKKSNSISFIIGVTKEDIPTVKNNIDTLMQESSNSSLESLIGSWTGTYEYYAKNVHMPYTLFFDISVTSTGDVIIKPNESRAEFEKFYDIKFVEPLLTYTFEGHTTMLDGTPIPIRASLVHNDSTLQGLYQESLGEYSGTEYFADFDAKLEKKTIDD